MKLPRQASRGHSRSTCSTSSVDSTAPTAALPRARGRVVAARRMRRPAAPRAAHDDHVGPTSTTSGTARCFAAGEVVGDATKLSADDKRYLEHAVRYAYPVVVRHRRAVPRPARRRRRRLASSRPSGSSCSGGWRDGRPRHRQQQRDHVGGASATPPRAGGVVDRGGRKRVGGSESRPPAWRVRSAGEAPGPVVEVGAVPDGHLEARSAVECAARFAFAAVVVDVGRVGRTSCAGAGNRHRRGNGHTGSRPWCRTSTGGRGIATAYPDPPTADMMIKPPPTGAELPLCSPHATQGRDLRAERHARDLRARAGDLRAARARRWG